MYHCYFLINYIGPPKVFFLSFGPLFKKFAHHWSRMYCGVDSVPHSAQKLPETWGRHIFALGQGR